MEYSKKNVKHTNSQLFWNMEYSGIFQKRIIKAKYIFHWNIWNGIFQKNCKTRKILKFLEYGIFQEYSKKIVKQVKYGKFWNMELEYSKKCKTGRGGVKFNHVIFFEILTDFTVLVEEVYFAWYAFLDGFDSFEFYEISWWVLSILTVLSSTVLFSGELR